MLMPLLGAFECGYDQHMRFGSQVGLREPPVWSPDGTRLMYGEFANLFLVEADGSSLQRFFDRPLRAKCCDGDFSPSISPDGTRVAFATMRERRGPFWFLSSEPGIEIGISALAGTGYRMLTNEGALFSDPVWSPDGSRIAFKSGQHRGRIYTIAPDGSDVRSVTPPSIRFAEDHPVWSPDGRHIAFLTQESYQDDAGVWLVERILYTVSAEGGEQRRISGTAAQPAWSPDGSLIAFASQVRRYRPPTKLYTSLPAGSELKQVAELELLGDVTSLFWSRDGSWFLVVGREYERNSWEGLEQGDDPGLYAVRTDGSHTRKLAVLGGYPLIALSPDGSRVAVRDLGASTSGDPVLYTMALDGSDKRILARWGANRG